MAVDLAQSGVAARLHHRDHAIDPLDVIDFSRTAFRP